MSPQINDNNNITVEMSEDDREAAILKQIIESQRAKFLPPTAEELEEIDRRSVYMGNVDFNSTTKEIEEHFDLCGKIVRVTIPKDKFYGRQRNFAYVEFEKASSVPMALVLNGSTFRNRKVFVSAKRTKKPGMGMPPTGKVPRAPKGKQFAQKPIHAVRVVKYVYVNTTKTTTGSHSKRFKPY